MLAAVIERPGAVVVRDTAPPQAAGLAMVRVTQAGVCGTDRVVAAEGVPALAACARPEQLKIVLDVAGP